MNSQELFMSNSPNTLKNPQNGSISSKVFTNRTDLSLKKLINPIEDQKFDLEPKEETLFFHYNQACSSQASTVFSQLYICKKKPVDALQDYNDTYPLLFLRKKLLFIK